MLVGSCGGAGGAGAAATRRGGVAGAGFPEPAGAAGAPPGGAGAGVGSAVGGGGGGFLCNNLWGRRCTFFLRAKPVCLTDEPIVVPIVASCFFALAQPESAVT